MSQLVSRFDAVTGGRNAPLNREARHFLMFALVGSSGFIVDFVVRNLLIFRAGMPAWQANTISFTLAVTNTFIWNRLWTFPESRRRELLPQPGKFFLVNLEGWAINEIIFRGVTRYCGGNGSHPGSPGTFRKPPLAVLLCSGSSALAGSGLGAACDMRSI